LTDLATRLMGESII